MGSLPRAMELPAPARDELRALRTDIESEDEPELLAQQRHLFARVPPPENLEPGDAWQVDLAAGTFVHTRDGDPVTLADAQLVATRGTDDTWLWPWHNPSVDPRGYAAIQAGISRVPHTAALRELDRFYVSDEDASRLAHWIAAKCGFFAAYPATSNGTTAWLALRPRVTAERTDGDPHTMWCSGCGRAHHTVSVLVRGRLGAICEHCIKLALRARESTELPEDLDDDYVDSELVPCLLSGEYYPRLFLPYNALAWNTLDTLADILRKGGHLD